MAAAGSGSAEGVGCIGGSADSAMASRGANSAEATACGGSLAVAFAGTAFGESRAESRLLCLGESPPRLLLFRGVGEDAFRLPRGVEEPLSFFGPEWSSLPFALTARGVAGLPVAGLGVFAALGGAWAGLGAAGIAEGDARGRPRKGPKRWLRRSNIRPAVPSTVGL